MLPGYAGKMLFVDLAKGTWEEKELLEDLAKDYIGGYGIGAKILYNLMPPGADALGPENILGFVTGPVTATKAFFGGRYTLVHKSPVTGGWNDANSGGYFGPELKKAGFDAVFLSGLSENPVYLYINDGKVEIRDAAHLWGKDTKETWAALIEETGEPKLRVVAIGPAGEKVSLLACPINDGHRAPGRGGGGAVMGSKKLKAIAVRGTGVIAMVEEEKILAMNKEMVINLKNNPGSRAFGEMGTGAGTPASALNGDSPVKNWGGIGVVDFGEDAAEKLGAAALDQHKVRKYNCANCPLGCGAEYVVKTGRWPLAQTERPEYETAAAFGSNMLNSEADAVLKCNEICNRYGLDTISTGGTVTWAMECYNNGVLSREELDDIDLTWGNGEAIVALTQKIADQDGCGAVLAHGSASAAKTWGKGAEFLQTVLGIELPMHDPRLAPGFARTYQYDPTPARHVKGGLGFPQMFGAPIGDKYDYDDTGKLDVMLTANQEVQNCVGFCTFMAQGGLQNAEIRYLEAVTGRPFTAEDSLKTGLRILNLRHAFNLREGLTPKDFVIPARCVGKPPQRSGPVADVDIDHEKLGKNFFAQVNWDFETGKPSLDSLRELGSLDEVIKDLYDE
ncbi:MAG TPA: aldehyde ferredoxin oxidoreductase family protein [Oscillospiraceae bacterium]|nr:aldehyde ferredoxin oxidoreductase family protein [Oscillospiraceae bacterium]